MRNIIVCMDFIDATATRIVELDPATWGFTERDNDRVIEPTDYRVWVGSSSEASLGGRFEVVEK